MRGVSGILSKSPQHKTCMLLTPADVVQCQWTRVWYCVILVCVLNTANTTVSLPAHDSWMHDLWSMWSTSDFENFWLLHFKILSDCFDIYFYVLKDKSSNEIQLKFHSSISGNTNQELNFEGNIYRCNFLCYVAHWDVHLRKLHIYITMTVFGRIYHHILM